MSDFFGLGVAPWVVVSAGTSWFAQQFLTARKARREERKDTLDHDAQLKIHHDGLTFDLLTSARSEMAAARIEIEGLRSEVNQLRSLEMHMFHFEQALDHIEAILISEDTEQRATAEKNARAFLNRMRRLAEAKGTIANETQRQDSAVAVAERAIGKEGKKP